MRALPGYKKRAGGAGLNKGVDVPEAGDIVRRPRRMIAARRGGYQGREKGLDSLDGERKVRRPPMEIGLEVVLYNSWFLFELWTHRVFPSLIDRL